MDGDVGHHVDQYMLLDIERARVEGEFPTAENLGQHPGAGGEDRRECLSQWVCDGEYDVRRERRCRVAEVEECVETGASED